MCAATPIRISALVVIGLSSTVGPADAQQVSSQAGPIAIESLAKLEHPWAMSFLPDGRLLITEKPGRLRIFADGKLSAPIGGVPKVAFHKQGGLLEVRVDPNFAQNQFVYLSFTEAAEQQPPNAKEERDERVGPNQDLKDTVLKGGAVARGRLDGNTLHDVTVIWRQVPKTIGRGHFGGRMVFARDGKLFITSGDRQRFDPAQDMNSNLGKIVRINSDGSVPKDNPFVGKPDARDDIWAVGVRNPLGAAIHPTTGQLWYNDMGPKGGDEIVMVERGRNYGWPQVSEGPHYNEEKIPPHATRSEFTPPNYFWAGSIAPAGFAFYTGNRFQGWNGNALIGGLVSKSLFRLTIDGAKVSGEERIAINKRIRDVIQAPDGGILLLIDGDDGELLRLAPSATTGARP